MSFLWPWQLSFLLLLPVFIGLYIWLLARPKKGALRFSNVVMLAAAVADRKQWRRHVPPALLLGSLALLFLGAGRPVASIAVATRQRTVILAMDVSGSMRAIDVSPSRLGAAQAAARKFVTDLPSDARVGVVSFDGEAQLVQQAISLRQDVIDAPVSPLRKDWT